MSVSPWNNPNSKAAYHPDSTPIGLWTKAAYNKESVNVKLVYGRPRTLLNKDRPQMQNKKEHINPHG